MPSYFHSVMLNKDKCKGCTHCIKRCPTEAIRVRNGKAVIIKERCIDCGECIRVCPYHAKLAVTDDFKFLENYKYNIALPAPSFYGQFKSDKNISSILSAFKKIGFDEVFEVANGAEIATKLTSRLLKEGKFKKPAINSACPVVVRLIRERFPDLLDNIINVLSPMEISAYVARLNAVKKTGLDDKDIGVFFITPCPAKVTSIKSPLTLEKSFVSGAISASEVYVKIYPYVKSNDDADDLPYASNTGIAWGRSGGESEGINIRDYIVVDGINNVIKILEEIENNKIDDVDFIELSACPGGCVGGPLNLANSFVSSTRIKHIIAKEHPQTPKTDLVNHDFIWEKKVEPDSSMKLDEDINLAVLKMEQIEDLYANMPRLDCGSCGAPSCKALAEDYVRGFGNLDDCIFRMREKIKELED